MGRDEIHQPLFKLGDILVRRLELDLVNLLRRRSYNLVFVVVVVLGTQS